MCRRVPRIATFCPRVRVLPDLCDCRAPPSSWSPIHRTSERRLTDRYGGKSAKIGVDIRPFEIGNHEEHPHAGGKSLFRAPKYAGKRKKCYGGPPEIGSGKGLLTGRVNEICSRPTLGPDVGGKGASPDTPLP